MTTLTAVSFVSVLVAGSAAMMLAACGLKRTKNLGFLFLAAIAAGVSFNGIARSSEYGSGTSIHSPSTAISAHQVSHRWRAIEAPVLLAMLGLAALILQSNEKKG